MLDTLRKLSLPPASKKRSSLRGLVAMITLLAALLFAGWHNFGDDLLARLQSRQEPLLGDPGASDVSGASGQASGQAFGQASGHTSGQADTTNNAAHDMNGERQASSRDPFAQDPFGDSAQNGQEGGRHTGEGAGDASRPSSLASLASLAIPPSPPSPSSSSSPDALSAMEYAPSRQSSSMPIVYSGNLGALTDLKAQLEELKLRVALAEQEQRLRALNAPEPALVSRELLAALTPPSSGQEAGGTSASSTRLVSVQSSGSSVSATVSTADGPVVLRPGDSFQSSKVQNITDDAVILASGRRITWE